MLHAVLYDGSFEGLLSAIFDIYDYRINDPCIMLEKNYQKNIFNKEHITHSEESKAKRVWKGLQLRISQHALMQVYRSFLSELPQIENAILSYVQYVFRNATSVECDYSNEAVLTITETAKKVGREKHRMEAFVRFQLTKDQLYYAVVQPDFNVLPLIIKHFEKRYADQRWMIYDSHRKFGIYYDLVKTTIVEMEFNEDPNNIENIVTEDEPLYQQLWQQYFNSVNIAARKNLKLHIRHMPKRYWKYLIEKRIDNS